MRTLGRLLALVFPLALCVPVAVSLPDVAEAGPATAQCRRTLPSYPVLHAGDRRPAVRTLQCAINDLGLGPVVVDGYYGPQTKREVWKISRNFEGDIADPHEITAGFWTLLYGGQLPHRVLRPGDQGHAVRVLQRALRAAGYAIVVDGDFGPQTRSVLMAYQESYGATPTGTVNSDTRFLLSTGGYS
jgi:peptidoglycan hydrolase-like protein with peptidoglycan-binding domain